VDGGWGGSSGSDPGGPGLGGPLWGRRRKGAAPADPTVVLVVLVSLAVLCCLGWVVLAIVDGPAPGS
jgi:hypothetical protein